MDKPFFKEKRKKKKGVMWGIPKDLTGFVGLRKIDITNKEVPKSAFFVSLKGFFTGTWFLLKELFLSV